MKKTAKSLLIALLTMMLALSFAGCKKTEEAAVKSEDGAAKEAVTAFMDATCDFEFAKMADYTDDDAFKKNLGEENMDKVLEEAVKEQTSQLEAADQQVAASAADDEVKAAYSSTIKTMIVSIEDYYKKAGDLVKSKQSYEIKEVKKDGDKFVASVVFKTVDGEDFNKAVKAIDGEALSQEAISELKASGKLTDTTSQALGNIYIYEVSSNKLLAKTLEALENAKDKEITLELVVVKSDDKWVIETGEADFDKLVDALKENIIE